MDASAIMTAISSIGFPSAMCVVLLVQMQKEAQMHKEELTMLSKFLNENTLTIQKLADRLEVHYENVRKRYESNKEI